MEKKIIIDSNPIPQPRPRVTRWGTYDPVKDKKTWIKSQIYEQFHERLTCPIEIEMKFYMPISKNMSKKYLPRMLSGEIRHIKRPDADNLYKLATDCMNDIVYRDDSQIYKFLVEKKYSDNPRTEILVKWD